MLSLYTIYTLPSTVLVHGYQKRIILKQVYIRRQMHLNKVLYTMDVVSHIYNILSSQYIDLMFNIRI